MQWTNPSTFVLRRVAVSSEDIPTSSSALVCAAPPLQDAPTPQADARPDVQAIKHRQTKVLGRCPTQGAGESDKVGSNWNQFRMYYE